MHPRQRDLWQGQVLVSPLVNVAVSCHQSFGDVDRAMQTGPRLVDVADVQLSLAEHGVGHRGAVGLFQVVGFQRQQFIEGACRGLGACHRLQQVAGCHFDLRQPVVGGGHAVANQRIVGLRGIERGIQVELRQPRAACVGHLGLPDQRIRQPCVRLAVADQSIDVRRIALQDLS